VESRYLFLSASALANDSEGSALPSGFPSSPEDASLSRVWDEPSSLRARFRDGERIPSITVKGSRKPGASEEGARTIRCAKRFSCSPAEGEAWHATNVTCTTHRGSYIDFLRPQLRRCASCAGHRTETSRCHYPWRLRHMARTLRFSWDFTEDSRRELLSRPRRNIACTCRNPIGSGRSPRSVCSYVGIGVSFLRSSLAHPRDSLAISTISDLLADGTGDSSQS